MSWCWLEKPSKNLNCNIRLLQKMQFKLLSAKCWPFCLDCNVSTHWGRVTHVCVSKLTIIGSDDGFLPGRRQATISTNAGIFVNWTLRNKLQWNLDQNLYIFIQENVFENVVRKLVAICLGLNVLTPCANSEASQKHHLSEQSYIRGGL